MHRGSDDAKNVINMHSKGITITDINDNKIEMNDDTFIITSMFPLKIDASGQAVEVIADKIDLNKG